jgi:hypothetical protein
MELRQARCSFPALGNGGPGNGTENLTVVSTAPLLSKRDETRFQAAADVARPPQLIQSQPRVGHAPNSIYIG